MGGSGRKNKFQPFVIISNNVGRGRNMQVCLAQRGCFTPEYRVGKTSLVCSLQACFLCIDAVIVSLFIIVIISQNV